MTDTVNIKEIRINNFRCLEELVLSFVESPIVALYAGNDSGKSSAVKAIETIMYNNERDIKNYIRTGTKGFEISIVFMDNSRITRVKTAAANVYSLYDTQGKLVGTWDKLGNDIPDVIKQIFNVRIEDATGELLNLRTCESLLLFSLTKTTDNYKMVHSCISSNYIEQAYAVGNNRIKELDKTIGKSVELRDDLYAQANRITTIDDAALNKINADQAQLNNMIAIETQLFEVCNSKIDCDEKRSKIQSTDPAKLKLLIENMFTDAEFDRLNSLSEALLGSRELTAKRSQLNTSKIEELLKESIDDKDIDKLAGLEETISLMSVIRLKKTTTVDTSKLDEASELIKQLDLLMTQVEGLKDVLSNIESIKNRRITQEDTQKQLESLTAQLKSSTNVRYDVNTNSLVKNCEHCNEEVFFGLNDLELVDLT